MKTKKVAFGPVQRTILDWLEKQPAGRLFSPHTVAQESGLIMMDAVESRNMDLISTAYTRARACLSRLTVITDHRPMLVEMEEVEFEGYYFTFKQYAMTAAGRRWYRSQR